MIIFFEIQNNFSEIGNYITVINGIIYEAPLHNIWLRIEYISLCRRIILWELDEVGGGGREEEEEERRFGAS